MAQRKLKSLKTILRFLTETRIDDNLVGILNKRTRTILWGAGLFIVFAFIVTLAYVGYRIYPYVRPAPITDDEAEALSAEYEKLAEKIESRPAADREALEKLLDDWSRQFKNAPEITFDKCPAFSEDFGQEVEAFLKEFSEFSNAVAGIIDDGFVWRQEYNIQSDIIKFAKTKRWVYWEMAAAYLEVKSGEINEAISRISRVQKVVATLYETPMLLNAILSFKIEHIIYQGVAASIPYFNEGQLNQIAALFQIQPSAVNSLKESVKLEALQYSRLFEGMGKTPNPDIANRQINAKLREYLRILIVRFIYRPWYRWFHRERKFYLALHRDTLKMLEAGELSENSSRAEFMAKGYRSFFLSLFEPPSGPDYNSLYKKAVRIETKRKNIITALRAEAALSEEERLGERTYPYDDERFIYISDKIGCIKENKDKPEQ